MTGSPRRRHRFRRPAWQGRDAGGDRAAGQPAELAPAYVLLASDDGSYMTGTMVPVTGGRPML